MGKEKARDLFMQFAAVRVLLDGADSSTLVEGKVPTGLSVRGGLIWLIHQVEWMLPNHLLTQASVELEAAVCTVAGLAAMPQIHEKGVVAVDIEGCLLLTEGMTYFRHPVKDGFLPPVPLAAPNLSIYAKSGVDDANVRGEAVIARVGFTTAPLTNDVYAEIAETWGY